MNASIDLLLDKANIAIAMTWDYRKAGGGDRLDIRRIHELGADSTDPLLPDVLYVADTTAVYAQAPRLEGMSVAIAGDPTLGRGLAQMRHCRLVSMPAFESSRRLMNALVAAQRAVDDLDARLMWATLEQDCLGAMVAIVSEELHEPVLATDADDVLAAYATPDGVEVTDEAFLHVLTDKCLMPDMPLYDDFTAAVPDDVNAAAFSVARIVLPESEREYLNAPILRDGVSVLDVLANNEGGPFARSASDVLLRVKLILEQVIRAGGLLGAASPDHDSCVHRLLDHVFVPQEVIEGYLRARGWSVDDAYWCLLAQASDERGALMLTHLARQLRLGIMRKAVVVEHNGEVACAVRVKDCPYDLGKLGESLTRLARRFSVHMGVSCPFRDFRELRRYYDSCRTAISYGQAENPPRTVSFFDDYAARHLEKALFGRSINEVLLDARAVELKLYDDQHGGELLRTLLVYLECGQNKTLAASKLFIHRNTLVYRVGQIEKVAGLDLARLDADRLFHLMYTCRYLM